jgi:FtsZ-interacting cell division protein ZipA
MSGCSFIDEMGQNIDDPKRFEGQFKVNTQSVGGVGGIQGQIQLENRSEVEKTVEVSRAIQPLQPHQQLQQQPQQQPQQLLQQQLQQQLEPLPVAPATQTVQPLHSQAVEQPRQAKNEGLMNYIKTLETRVATLETRLSTAELKIAELEGSS